MKQLLLNPTDYKSAQSSSGNQIHSHVLQPSAAICSHLQQSAAICSLSRFRNYWDSMPTETALAPVIGLWLANPAFPILQPQNWALAPNTRSLSLHGHPIMAKTKLSPAFHGL